MTRSVLRTLAVALAIAAGLWLIIVGGVVLVMTAFDVARLVLP